MAVGRAGWGLECRDPPGGEGWPGVSRSPGPRPGQGWGWGPRHPGGRGAETAACAWYSLSASLCPGVSGQIHREPQAQAGQPRGKGEAGGPGGGEQGLLWPDPHLPISASPHPPGASRCYPAHAAAANPNPGQGVSGEGNLSSIPHPVTIGTSLNQGAVRSGVSGGPTAVSHPRTPLESLGVPTGRPRVGLRLRLLWGGGRGIWFCISPLPQGSPGFPRGPPGFLEGGREPGGCSYPQRGGPQAPGPGGRRGRNCTEDGAGRVPGESAGLCTAGARPAPPPTYPGIPGPPGP